jgi:hypothetical protein
MVLTFDPYGLEQDAIDKARIAWVKLETKYASYTPPVASREKISGLF